MSNFIKSLISKDVDGFKTFINQSLAEKTINFIDARKSNSLVNILEASDWILVFDFKNGDKKSIDGDLKKKFKKQYTGSGSMGKGFDIGFNGSKQELQKIKTYVEKTYKQHLNTKYTTFVAEANQLNERTSPLPKSDKFSIVFPYADKDHKFVTKLTNLGGRVDRKKKEVVFDFSSAAERTKFRKKNEKILKNLVPPRQLKDPKKETMVVDKKGKVVVIDKKDEKKYLMRGYELAESTKLLDEQTKQKKIGTTASVFEFPSSRMANQFAYDMANSGVATTSLFDTVKVEVHMLGNKPVDKSALQKYLKKSRGKKINESMISKLQESHATKIPVDIDINGEIIHVTPDISENIITLHDELNEDNQIRLRELIQENVKSFVEINDFAKKRMHK